MSTAQGGSQWGAHRTKVAVLGSTGSVGSNTLDVLAFLNDWANGNRKADCNGDGVINTLDVLCFLNAWAAGC